MEIGELFVFLSGLRSEHERSTDLGGGGRSERSSLSTNLLYASALPKPEERRRQTGLRRATTVASNAPGRTASSRGEASRKERGKAVA